jgi:ABC-type sugar transport system ATPase subunit
VLVSSDVEELCALSDRVLVLAGGGVAHVVEGDDVTPDAVDLLVHEGAVR